MINSPVEFVIWVGLAVLSGQAWMWGMVLMANFLLRKGIRWSVQPGAHW